MKYIVLHRPTTGTNLVIKCPLNIKGSKHALITESEATNLNKYVEKYFYGFDVIGAYSEDEKKVYDSRFSA